MSAALARRSRLARVATLAAAALSLAGCGAIPDAGATGRRVLVDGFVTLTSPVQVPAMAGRDAWNDCSGSAAKKLLLPVFFVGRLCQHTGLSALHTVDLVAAPIHLFVGNGPPKIYVPYELPMSWQPDAQVGREAGELALYGVAGVGGTVILWWYTTIFVPNLFQWVIG